MSLTRSCNPRTHFYSMNKLWPYLQKRSRNTVQMVINLMGCFLSVCSCREMKNMRRMESLWLKLLKKIGRSCRIRHFQDISPKDQPLSITMRTCLKMEPSWYQSVTSILTALIYISERVLRLPLPPSMTKKPKHPTAWSCKEPKPVPTQSPWWQTITVPTQFKSPLLKLWSVGLRKVISPISPSRKENKSFWFTRIHLIKALECFRFIDLGRLSFRSNPSWRINSKLSLKPIYQALVIGSGSILIRFGLTMWTPKASLTLNIVSIATIWSRWEHKELPRPNLSFQPQELLCPYPSTRSSRIYCGRTRLWHIKFMLRAADSLRFTCNREN